MLARTMFITICFIAICGCDIQLKEQSLAFTCEGVWRTDEEGALWGKFNPDTLEVHRAGVLSKLQGESDYITFFNSKITGHIVDDGTSLMIYDPADSDLRVFVLNKFDGTGAFNVRDPVPSLQMYHNIKCKRLKNLVDG